MSAAEALLQETDSMLWQPAPERIANSRMKAFLDQINADNGAGLTDYDSLQAWSVENLEDFWSRMWDFAGVTGEKGSVVLADGDKMPGAQFFPEARLSWAENMLRRRDDNVAIIFRGEDKVERRMTFRQVYDATSRMVQALKGAGVGEGDRVAGFMPNMPETIIAAMASNALGAIWSSASPDFGVQGVIDRFGQVEPKVLIAAEGYYYGGKTLDCIEKLQGIMERLPSVETLVVVPYTREQADISSLPKAVHYADFTGKFEAGEIAFARLPFNHPLFIMFSSGTTGVPKCIVHGQGGTLIQHLKEHILHCDTGRDDRIFYFTTCGWMMWNWLITAMAAEATLLLYDGNPFYPDANVLFDYADAHQMKLFGTSAKYIDAVKKQGFRPVETHRLDSVKVMTSTGSPLAPESFDFVYDAIKSDIHLASISGGTDIVSCFVLGNPMSPVYRGELQGAGLGMAVAVWNDDGKPVVGEKGELVCTKPFPAMPVMFWNDADGEKYRKAYFDSFPGIWCHGDWIEQTEHNGFIITGRSDATLNPGGVRIGTAEIYRVVEQLPEVIESIAIGQDWDNDVRVVLFVVLANGVELTDDLVKTIRTRIREGASPRHMPAKVVAVSDIPRTKSGKITEIAVRDIVHGRAIKNVEALANAAALDQYRDRPELAD